MPIEFHTENIDFVLKEKPIIHNWIKDTCKSHKKKIGEISFIFCNDSHLHSINLEYLSHDTLTDIITFDYSEADSIEGDIFISIERVRENANEIGHSFETELHRVMIHGILHLIGYKDKTTHQKSKMRNAEDAALLDLKTTQSVPRGTLN